MTTVLWDFEIEGVPHRVRLDFHFWSTRRVITLDEKVVIDVTPVNNLAATYRFRCGAATVCELRMTREFLAIRREFELWVDGRHIPGVRQA